MQKSSSTTMQRSSSVSLVNMDEIKRVFNGFDKNGDGRISSSDLTEVLRSLGTETSPEELKQMMDQIDKNGDGSIDLEEFTNFLRSTSNGGGDSESGVRELRDAFDLYDKDKNGLISASELHMVLKGLGEKCSIRDCSMMIKSFDLDGDGSVSFEEFKKMMTGNKG